MPCTAGAQQTLETTLGLYWMQAPSDDSQSKTPLHHVNKRGVLHARCAAVQHACRAATPHNNTCDSSMLLQWLTACRMVMLVGPPRLGIQKKPLVSRPSSAALLSALRMHKNEHRRHRAAHTSKRNIACCLDGSLPGFLKALMPLKRAQVCGLHSFQLGRCCVVTELTGTLPGATWAACLLGSLTAAVPAAHPCTATGSLQG